MSLVPSAFPNLQPPPGQDAVEFQRCLEYLTLSETQRNMTKQDIADHFKISRQTLWLWVSKWSKSGLMRRLKEEYLSEATIQDLERVNREVMAAFPMVVQRQIKTALSSRSDKVSLEAAEWLRVNFVVPMEIDARRSDGQSEKEYLKSFQANGSPLSISSDDD